MMKNYNSILEKLVSIYKDRKKFCKFIKWIKTIPMDRRIYLKDIISNGIETKDVSTIKDLETLIIYISIQPFILI